MQTSQEYFTTIVYATFGGGGGGGQKEDFGDLGKKENIF